MRHFYLLVIFLAGCNLLKSPERTLAEDVVEYINTGNDELIENSLMSLEQNRQVMNYAEDTYSAAFLEQMRKDLVFKIGFTVKSFRERNKLNSKSEVKIRNIKMVDESELLGNVYIELSGIDSNEKIKLDVVKGKGILYLLSLSVEK